MARCKNQAPEQIVNVLRQIEVAIANGKTTPLACKDAGITEQTDPCSAVSGKGVKRLLYPGHHTN